MRPLPAELSSVSALQAYLGLGAAEAKFMGKHGRHRYRAKAIPKRRGGVRLLTVPDDRLKFLQRKLLAVLELLYQPKPAAHGFVRGRGVITNANAHQGRPYLLNLDLEDFFGSISRNRVRGVLCAVGVPDQVAQLISDLTVIGNQLPQGAPTSPLLSNMVAFRLDKDLTAYARKHRLRYTRYADDITFSSHVKPTALFSEDAPDPGPVDDVRLSPALKLILTSNSFRLNAAKTRYCGKTTRKEVTGLVVNDFTNLRRTFVRDARSSLYRIETLGLAAAQSEFRSRYGSDALLKDVVRGRIEWIAQVRGRSFDPYRKLAHRYNGQFPGTPLPIDPTNDEVMARAIYVIDYADDGAGPEGAGQGTAFFLEGVGLVTAYHVLAKMKSAWAVLYRPDRPTVKYKARFGPKASEHHDLAILEHDVPVEAQMFLRASSGGDAVKSGVTALGYPEYGHGDGLVQKPGKIVGFNVKSLVRYVEVDALLGDGLSGGPVINDRYEVVGVVHKGGALEPKQLAVHIAEAMGL